MERLRKRADLARETLSLIEKIQNGAARRIKVFETNDFSLEGGELSLKLTPVRGNEASPYAEGNIVGSAARQEKSAHDGGPEFRLPGDGVDGLGVCRIVPPGGVEE